MQLAWPGGRAVVDPLAVDVAPLRRLLEGSGTAVMHAASQDLEVLDRACAAVPRRLFDTQVAAGFVGFSSPSLQMLVRAVAGVELTKGDRLTDWLRRPLTADQLAYAVSDVAHLLEVAARLRDELAAIGRLAWADEECELLRTRRWGPPDPSDAWLRLKDAARMRGRNRAVAQAVAAWRERRAASSDRPPRFVLPDLVVLSIASRPPRSRADLAAMRGVDGRYLKGDVGEEILAAVREGLAAEPPPLPDRPQADKSLRPAVALVTAWVAQLAKDLQIDATLLATRADVTAFVAGGASSLQDGWRADLLADPLHRLATGELALAFDGEGGLALEHRSGRLVTLDLPRPTAPWSKEG